MRRIQSARRLAAVALVPVLITGVAACGSEDGSSAKDDTSQSDTSKDSDAPQPEAGDEVEAADFSQQVSDGFEDVTTARMSMAMSGQMEMSLEGDVDYTGEAPAMHVTMSMAGMAEGIDVIMLDGIMYMGVPGQDDKYTKIDLNDPNSPLAEQMDVDQLTGQMDMRESMKLYSSALTGVTFVGDDEVDGEELNRYAVTIDPSNVETLKESAEGLGEMTYDAWLDDDGVMRQMVMDMPAGMGSMTMKIGDLGADVSIEAPSADQIVTMPGM